MDIYWDMVTASILHFSLSKRNRKAILSQLILTRKLLVDPEELLAFVHHADETAEARVFGFEQGVEFAQGGAVTADGDAVFEIGGIRCAEEVADFGGFAEGCVNDGFAEVELFFDEFVGGFIEREFDGGGGDGEHHAQRACQEFQIGAGFLEPFTLQFEVVDAFLHVAVVQNGERQARMFTP